MPRSPFFLAAPNNLIHIFIIVISQLLKPTFLLHCPHGILRRNDAVLP